MEPEASDEPSVFGALFPIIAAGALMYFAIKLLSCDCNMDFDDEEEEEEEDGDDDAHSHVG
jgi:hypothetical protein